MVMLQLLEKEIIMVGRWFLHQFQLEVAHMSRLLLFYDGQNAEFKIYRRRRTSISPVIFIKSSDISMGLA